MLVPAKCPECGGLVEVDNEKRAGLCKYCGQPFVVEDAVQIFNTYFNTNNITNHNYSEGAVVNIYEDKSKDFVIEAGVLKEYHGESADVVIPDGIVEIGDNCFKGLKIKSVEIPDSVTTIGEYAFHWCTSLSSIKITNSITGIGKEAFNGCWNLNAVYIDDLSSWCSIHFCGYEANPLTFGKKLYLNGELITDLVIPESVISIKDFSFPGCTSIASITIPNSVKSIGHCAFLDCTNLISIKIPSSVTIILSAVFQNCINLESILIPNTTTSIGNLTFEGCENLKNVDIPIDLLIKSKNAFPEKLYMKIIKEHNVCRYCGGSFKGLFTEKCRVCGREKDY